MAISGSINNDTLSGTSADDIIQGLEGHDQLNGLDGHDLLQGGAGYDNLDGGAGNDTLDGGADSDVADYQAASAAINVNLALGTASDGQGGTDTLISIEWVYGSQYNDTLIGDAGVNLLLGNGGSDTLDGGAGNDILDGSAGSDSISGGAGGDYLSAGYGNTAADADTLTGGAGSDVYSVIEALTSGRVTRITDLEVGEHIHLSSSSPNTSLPILSGNDPSGLQAGQVMVGTASVGVSRLYVGVAGGSSTPAYIDLVGNYAASGFGWGADTVWISNGGWNGSFLKYDPAINQSQNLVGTAGQDTLTGGGANDTLSGLEGSDNLAGKAGHDLLQGGAGYDTLTGDAGNDTLDGGADTDTANYWLAPAAVNVNLALGTASDGQGGTDTLISIERVDGSQYNDTLIGDASNNLLYGGAGSDSISGGAGIDYLDANYSSTLSDADTLTGGAGSDVYSVVDALTSGRVTRITDLEVGEHIHLSYSLPNTSLPILSGNDPSGLQAGQVMVGTASVGVSRLYVGVAGSSTPAYIDLVGNYAASGFGWGADNVQIGGYGWSGSFLKYDPAINQSQNLVGTAGQDTLTGNNANDTLSGLEGSDNLAGKAGHDLLQGGAGYDNLDGGAGNDTLDGGADSDAADYGAAPAAINVNLALGTASDGQGGTDTLISIERVDGSQYNDTLIGDAGNNFLYGNGGSDTLDGGAGNDTLVGGAGNDTLDGGAGNDILDGSAGSDSISGGAGGDYLSAGYGNTAADADTLTGGAGSDVYSVIEALTSGRVTRITDLEVGEHIHLSSSSPNTSLPILSGNDPSGLQAGQVMVGTASVGVSRLYVGVAGSSTPAYIDLVGNYAASGFGWGADTVWISNGGWNGSFLKYDPAINQSQNLVGTAGQDTLTGGSANDTLSGLEGSDNLAGRAGHDLLQGGAGYDMLTGDAGNDTLDGGADTDTANYQAAPAAINVNLALGTASDGQGGTDTVISIEWVYGSQYNDTLIGDAGNNILYGNGGSDSISGGAGGDYLSAGYSYSSTAADADTLTGGAGSDVYSVVGALTSGRVTRITDLEVGEHIHLSYSLPNTSLPILSGNDPSGLQAGQVMVGTASVGVSRLYVGVAGSSTPAYIDLVGNYAASGFGWGADNVQIGGYGWSGSFLKYDPAINQSQNLVGTAGQDTLTGNNANDTLSGLEGSDNLAGKAGHDLLQGGAGYDNLDGGAGNDTLDGGADSDAADYGAAPAAINVNLALGTASDGQGGTDTLISIERVDGSQYNDTLIGDAGNNFLYGNGGSDTLDGGAGNDTLDGSAGSDSISGGAGGDYLSAGYGNTAADADTLTGGAGSDVYSVIEALTSGRVTRITDLEVGEHIHLSSSSPNTSLPILSGNDPSGLQAGQVMVGTASVGVSRLYVGVAGSSTPAYIDLVGNYAASGFGWGADTVWISNGGWNGSFLKYDPAINQSQNLVGTAGQDTLTGGSANDTLSGLEGSDNLAGRAGHDLLQGGAGYDMLTGDAGNDTLDGGADTDTANYQAAPAAINVNLALGTASDGQGGTDTLISIERVDGSQYNDTLIGDAGDNFLYGNGGSDTLDGGAGNDTLDGSAGSDSISGGGGDDELNGSVGNDTLDGGAGFDTANYEGVSGALTASLLTNTATGTDIGTDTLIGIENLYGGKGGDSLTGDANANILWGGKGNDTLTGGTGNDTLTGGTGNDTLTGGTGTDTFAYEVDQNAGSDTITDLQAGDKFSFSRPSGSVFSLQTTVLSGSNGVTLTNGQVLVGAPSGGFTTLYVGTDDTAGADITIQLQGSFAAGNFSVANNSFGGWLNYNGVAGNVINGTSGPDSLSGTSGNDVFNAGLGNDTLTGGAGTDTAQYNLNRSGLTQIGTSADGTVTITRSSEGEDYLVGIEQLSFTDTATLTVAQHTSAVGSAATPLYSVSMPGAQPYVLPTLYSGPVAGLQYQLLGSTGNDIVVASGGNDFLNLLGGDDAANAGAGNDVIDGGTGSNFLSGGAGTDVFFVDGRGGSVTWSTITDWQAGEQLSIWGWNPALSTMQWVASAGAAGFEGATLFIDLDANTTIDIAVTWSGKTQAELPVPVQFANPALLWFL